MFQRSLRLSDPGICTYSALGQAARQISAAGFRELPWIARSRVNSLIEIDHGNIYCTNDDNQVS